eukprot:6194511-Pleurochrysis_carterae.AAC.2
MSSALSCYTRGIVTKHMLVRASRPAQSGVRTRRLPCTCARRTRLEAGFESDAKAGKWAGKCWVSVAENPDDALTSQLLSKVELVKAQAIDVRVTSASQRRGEFASGSTSKNC